MPSTYCRTTGDATVWVSWVASAASTTSTCGGAWATWCETGRTSYCTATTAAWVTTADGRTRAIAPERPAWSPAPEPRELTAEERADRDRRAAEARAAREAAEAERTAAAEAADRRAEELLLAALSPEQKAEYAQDRSFHTRDRQGRRYRIRRAWSGHVTRLNDAGKETERYCIHPHVPVPLPDNQLLAKLMIEADEDLFLQTANVTRLRPSEN